MLHVDYKSLLSIFGLISFYNEETFLEQIKAQFMNKKALKFNLAHVNIKIFNL